VATNQPRNPTQFKFKPKEGQLGALFLAFQKDRAYQGITVNTCKAYEYAWSFFKPNLEPLELNYKVGKKPMNVEQRKQEEKKLYLAVKQRLRDRIDQGEIEGISLNTYLKNIRTFMNWLREEDQGPFLVFDWNESFDTLIVAESLHERRILTPDEIKLFKAYKPGANKFNQWRAWTMGFLMLDNGVRVAEAIDLKVPDVNLHQEMIDVVDGKGGKDRTIPNDSAAHAMMKYKIKWIDPYIGNRPPNTWYFFGTKDGKKLSQRNALRDLKVLFRKCGILPKKKHEDEPKLSWHNFRHTTLTYRLLNGQMIDKVQKLAGHKRLSTTEKYLHRGPGYLKQGHDSFSPLNVLPDNL